MIDLHSHLLPGIDDGASDMAASLAMARQYVDDGIRNVCCTPHILPGVYDNTGSDIRLRVAALQQVIREAGIDLTLWTGADNHLTADFTRDLKRGALLTLADSRYVLVEPSHHVMPPRLQESFFSLTLAGYVPILTHPERLRWVPDNFAAIRALAAAGVWMQVTAASFTGLFGRVVLRTTERMLDEGLVAIVATDAHDPLHRVPSLSQARETVARRLGEAEAWAMTLVRPMGVLLNQSPADLPQPLFGAPDRLAACLGEAAGRPSGDVRAAAGPVPRAGLMDQLRGLIRPRR